MPKYSLRCTEGHSMTKFLSFVELESYSNRHMPLWCQCGKELERDWAADFKSQYIPPRLDRCQFTMWGDIHDRSPREMARDKNVERYDPSLPHKPAYKPPTDEQLKSLIRSIPDHEFERVQRTQIDTSEEAVKQPVAS